MSKKTKRYDPIAKDIAALRAALGETQLRFAKHFHVTRTTIISWEQFGPPAYGPIREHVKLIMKKLARKVNGRARA